MANVIINDTNLVAIGDAIRSKNGTTDTYKPREMAAAIEAIETGGGGSGGDDMWKTQTINYLNSFYNSSSLSEFTIPAGVTTIADHAFTQRYNLETVNFENIEAITTIGQSAFYSCPLTNMSMLPPNLTQITYYSFNSSSIPLIELPAGITDISGSAFSGCTDLRLAELPANLTHIWSNAFSYATWGDASTKELIIPANATTIDYGAFQGVNLKKVIILADCSDVNTSINYSCFSNCTDLEDIWVYLPSGSQALNAPWGASNATVRYFTSRESMV